LPLAPPGWLALGLSRSSLAGSSDDVSQLLKKVCYASFENAGDSVRPSGQRVRQVPDDVDTEVVEPSAWWIHDGAVSQGALGYEAVA